MKGPRRFLQWPGDLEIAHFTNANCIESWPSFRRCSTPDRSALLSPLRSPVKRRAFRPGNGNSRSAIEKFDEKQQRSPRIERSVRRKAAAKPSNRASSEPTRSTRRPSQRPASPRPPQPAKKRGSKSSSNSSKTLATPPLQRILSKHYRKKKEKRLRSVHIQNCLSISKSKTTHCSPWETETNKCCRHRTSARARFSAKLVYLRSVSHQAPRRLATTW